MSPARRSLLTATAAGTLLGALWFVPSANATTADAAGEQRTTIGTTASETGPQGSAMPEQTVARNADGDVQLADTGAFDTTPYLAGGTFFLGVGAGFVVYSVRKERLGM